MTLGWQVGRDQYLSLLQTLKPAAKEGLLSEFRKSDARATKADNFERAQDPSAITLSCQYLDCLSQAAGALVPG